MKQILKKYLSPQLKEKLGVLKGRLIKGISQGVLFFLKWIPQRILVAVKMGLQVTKRLDYPKKEIFLIVDSDVEYSTRIHSCKKEPETIFWIENFLKKGDVLYDIGANAGAYSLVAAKIYEQDIKIYAFEPGFATFHQLMRNVLLNGCQKSIFPLQVALSNRTGMDTFNYSSLTPSAAMHALGDAVDFKGDRFIPVFKQLMLTYRLDDLINQFSLPLPNHIKIDVDGLEWEILEGASRYLDNPALRSILVEVDERTKESKVTQALYEREFKLHSKYKYTYGGDEGAYLNTYNYIFCRENILVPLSR